jgi:hypothetical protein
LVVGGRRHAQGPTDGLDSETAAMLLDLAAHFGRSESSSLAKNTDADFKISFADQDFWPSASGTSSPPDAIKPRLFPDRSPRRSSANAASGRFSARPRRADAGGPTSIHLSHSTAYVKNLLHDSSFSVRDTQ